VVHFNSSVLVRLDNERGALDLMRSERPRSIGTSSFKLSIRSV
jgi:hypothetical protein